MNRVSRISPRGSRRDESRVKRMPYNLLEEITDNFAKERVLGSGTFGTVYKGRDKDGREMAVKRLHNHIMDLDGEKFRRELNNLLQLNSHPNIVQLLGFCDTAEEVSVNQGGDSGRITKAFAPHWVLCFEYIQHGDLRAHLSDEDNGMDWQVRFKIIKGVCEGIKYLHSGLENPVWHLDLKPENILLDKNMVPKIADFGLSRLIPDERNTRRTDTNLGTLGYIPPEYIMLQTISKEFDIYSLGVIIMEIMLGAKETSRCYSFYSNKPVEFVNHVHNKWSQRIQNMLMETSLETQYCKQVKTCIEIALDCVKDKKERPTIGHIVDQLNATERNVNYVSALEEIENSAQKKHIAGSTAGVCNRFASNIMIAALWPFNNGSNGVKDLDTNLVENLAPEKRVVGSTAAVYKRFGYYTKMIALWPFNGSNGVNHHGINLVISDSRRRITKYVLSNWYIQALRRRIRFESQLLSVEPLELQFGLSSSSDLLPCRLKLTNNTDEYVVFRFLSTIPWAKFSGRFGYLEPRCSHSHQVTWSSERKKPPIGECFTLESTIAAASDLEQLLDISATKAKRRYDQFFKDARDDGCVVHEAKLKVDYRQTEVSSRLENQARKHVLNNWCTRLLYRGIHFESQLLSVEPPELQFGLGTNRFEGSGSSYLLPCWLKLTNNTDKYVAFRLLTTISWAKFSGRFGYVKPRFTHSHQVSWSSERKSPPKGKFFTLESTIATTPDLEQLLDVGTPKAKGRYDQLFKNAKDDGRTVHKLQLKVVYRETEVVFR
ncbi:hypothetical protein ACP4OV_015063 [Aristida adscensionis]